MPVSTEVSTPARQAAPYPATGREFRAWLVFQAIMAAEFRVTTAVDPPVIMAVEPQPSMEATTEAVHQVKSREATTVAELEATTAICLIL